MASNSEEVDDNLNDSFVDEPSGESEEEEYVAQGNTNEVSQISSLLLKLKNSGVVKSIPKQHCFTCEIDFDDSDEFNEHIIEHVNLPSIVLQRVDDDDDFINEYDDQTEWSSDAEKSSETVFKPVPVGQANTNITKIGGVTIKSTKKDATIPDTLMSLKNFGNLFIKKLPNIKSTKEEEDDNIKENDNTPPKEIKKIESSGSLKLTIKHSDKTFQVVNGTKKTIKSEVITTVQKLDEIMDENEEESEWDIKDKKDGILESIINVPIKTEALASENNEHKNEECLTSVENVQIKTECRSRPQTPLSSTDSSGNQIKVKSFAMEQMEKKITNESNIVIPKPMIIPKVEASESDNVIEINCDSDKEDDEIIFVSSSPVPDKKPPVGIEKIPNKDNSSNVSVSLHSSTTPTMKPVISNSISAAEKQHSFNWNAPSNKISDTLESLLADKNNDSLLENLLSSHRKDGISDLGSSEYISLDKLGPQHTCDVCNVRFTNIELLENHKKSKGHSNQLVPSIRTSNVENSPNSLILSSYQQPDFLMNSLLPVKQLAETVSKIATVNTSTAPFTHQQNIMVNIQSFPGGMNQPMGVQSTHGPSSGYNYGAMGQMGGNFPSNYRVPSQNIPPGYPGQYPMPTQHNYPNAYSQYPPHPSMPQSMMSQQLNVPMNPNYPSQPYLSNHYSSQPGVPMPYPQTSMSQSLAPTQPMPTQQHQQPPTSTPSLPSVITLPHVNDSTSNNMQQNPEGSKSVSGGIKIQSIQTINGPSLKPTVSGPRMPGPRGMSPSNRGVRGPRVGGGIRPGMRPVIKQGIQVSCSVRGTVRPTLRPGMKRPVPTNGASASPSKKRMDMLLPDRHDNEDCQVVSMQQQRDGLPLIQSIQGSKEKNPGVQLSSQITVTKTRVRAPTPPSSKDANAVANMLASRGIKITPKSRTPPPSINIPNLGSGISITSTKAEDNFEVSCAICSKNFPSHKILSIHMAQVHPPQKNFKCPSCPISYTTAIQLDEHKQVFHSNSAEMGLPVVDLTQHATLRKLSSIGITNFIPLANKDQGNSCFAIPIVSVQSALSGNSSSLSALSANGILSLGPIKVLPKV